MTQRVQGRDQRRKLLLELVQKEEVSSQVQLQSRLAALGHPVNQATLSRDLREMGVIKVPLGSTGSRYVLPGTEMASHKQYEESFRRLVLSVDRSLNLLVLKTLPGHAQAAALAMDNLRMEGVLGTVAGDDTFFVVLRDCLEIDANADAIRELAGLIPVAGQSS